MSRMPRTLRPIDYVNISILGFGLASFSTSLGQIILPMRVIDLAPESLKNTYLGLLTFVGMGMAMLVQPLVGYISDRTTLKWGRRRPYILLGSTFATVLMLAIGLVNHYIWLAMIAVLIQISANIAQNPYDAIVRDQVPQEQRGKVSSIRAVTAAAGAIAFTLIAGILMDRHISTNDIWLWLSLTLPASFLFTTMILTLTRLKETPFVASHQLTQTGIKNGADDLVPNTHPQLPIVLLAGFLFMLAGGILQTYTLYFLRDVINLDNPASAVGILAITVGAAILITLYPAGLLADKIGRRPLLLLSAFLGTTGSILFFIAQDLSHVIIIGTLLGIAVGIFIPAGRALIIDMISGRRAGEQLGVANFALVGGLALAKLGGIGIDALNTQGDNLGYYALLGVCATSFFIGAVLIAMIRVNPNPGPPEQPKPETPNDGIHT